MIKQAEIQREKDECREIWKQTYGQTNGGMKRQRKIDGNIDGGT